MVFDSLCPRSFAQSLSRVTDRSGLLRKAISATPVASVRPSGCLRQSPPRLPSLRWSAHAVIGPAPVVFLDQNAKMIGWFKVADFVLNLKEIRLFALKAFDRFNPC